MTHEHAEVRNPGETHAAEQGGALRTRAVLTRADHRSRVKSALAWLPVIAVVVLALLAVWQALAAHF